MAPKKKEVQKFSLGEFIQDTTYGGSWADEVEDTYGTQPLPPSERSRYGQSTSGYGSGDRGGYDRGGYASLRDNLPQQLPDKPPYTAHLGNLSYDATAETVTDFFTGCNAVSVRIIEDREQNRPKGFAYAEFADLEGLKQALTLDGQSFQGRSIRIKVADPPKDRGDRGGGDSNRDLSDWTRRGPLADLPRSEQRRGPPSDFGDRRPSREPQGDDGKVRDFGNWERKGPLSPLPQAERPSRSRDGSRSRANDGPSDSFRANRKASPSWGPGEGRQQQEGSRPPRRDFAERQERPDRPDRAPTAAEKDTHWRSNMRPDLAAQVTPDESREGSEAPSSPAAAAPAAPAGRPRLNLTKRTVSEAPDVTSPALSATDPKASPFGAARPIDTATREKEIEEKRQIAVNAKKEADEKAKEERRLAKEAAAKEAAEKATAEKTAKESETAADETAAHETVAHETTANETTAKEPASDKTAEDVEDTKKPAGGEIPADASTENGDQKIPSRPREDREPREPRGENVQNPKSRSNDSGNWRQASGEARGGARGGHIPSGPRRGGGPPRGGRNDGGRNDGGRPPRANGDRQASSQAAGASEPSDSPTQDADGWTTVPNKGRRGGSTRA